MPQDVWLIAVRRLGSEKAFRDRTGIPDQRIGWILNRAFKVLSVRASTVHDGAHYPSDHFPVVAELGL